MEWEKTRKNSMELDCNLIYQCELIPFNRQTDIGVNICVYTHTYTHIFSSSAY